MNLYAQERHDAPSEVSNKDEVLKLLDDKNEESIKKGIDQIKKNPDLILDDNTREKICRIYASDQDK